MAKATFSFDEPAVRVLDRLADRKDISRSEVIRRALMLYDYVDANKAADHTLTIRKDDGREVALIVP